MVCAALSAHALQAQEGDLLEQINKRFEDFQKRSDEMFEQFEARTNRQFEMVKRRSDSLFLTFLKGSWKMRKTEEPVARPSKPKPKKTPVAPAAPKREKPVNIKPLPPKPSTLLPEDDFKNRIPKDLKPTLKKIYQKSKVKNQQFDFFGSAINLFSNKAFPAAPAQVSEAEIEQFFSASSDNKDVANWLTQMLYYSQTMNLNDWGFVTLLKKSAKSIYPGRVNAQNLMVWYGLLQAGYKAKVGYSDKNICLLLATKYVIYGAYYIPINGDKYFITTFGEFEDKRNWKIPTYDYPDNKGLLDLYLNDKMFVGDKTQNCKINPNFSDFEVDYNVNLVKFYDDYPQTGDFGVYFAASLSRDALSSLESVLQPKLAGKSVQEAVNYLLAFVQKGFKYKTDTEQFGVVNRTFFSEETLHFPYSDCEDRAILFSNLVTHFLGLKAVGLLYSNHMSTAVKFKTSDVQGDYLYYKNEKYIICDPTYIGARLGMAMQQHRGLKPRIIDWK